MAERGRLLVDGRDEAALEVLASRRDRGRGLLGRVGLDGAVLLHPCRSVHAVGMRFAIDVAFCDADGVVLRTLTMAPGRLPATAWRARAVLEAEAGAFRGWGLVPGSTVAIARDR